MIILIGPSASGKTEVAKELVRKYGYHKVITYTTRSMRVNEKDGIDYHFISLISFSQKIEEGFFFEHVFYNGNFYGTARADLDDKSVVILEPKGFLAYEDKSAKNIVSFFLDSTEEKRRLRMKERKDDEMKIEERILNDRKTFATDSVKDVDYILNSSDLSICELSREVDNLYRRKIKEA